MMRLFAHHPRLAVAALAAAFAGRAQIPEPFKISVDVNLVMLHPAVTDQKGQPVAGLAERNFQIYEDGIRQTVRLFRHEDVPVTAGLVVDHSTSMSPRMSDVIAGARAFVQASSHDDEMFVVNFNEKVWLGLPRATSFTNQTGELEGAIANAPVTGTTALYDALATGMGQLRAGKWEKKVLVVISDGGDNASRSNLAETMKAAAESSVIVYTIGIFDSDDPDRNYGVLRKLARVTGGEAYFPSQTDEVVAICRRIARDIRNQYTIGYVSTSAGRPGTWRKIRVVARGDGGKLSVRARTGYTAGAK